MPDGSEHQRVDDEWSAVETLRHLVFVHDSWFRRCCLGRTDLFTPMGLGTDFVSDQEEQGLDRSATPTLAEVRAVRDAPGRRARGLARDRHRRRAPAARAGARRPRLAAVRPRRSVAQCLRTVLDEEWSRTTVSACATSTAWTPRGRWLGSAA